MIADGGDSMRDLAFVSQNQSPDYSALSMPVQFYSPVITPTPFQPVSNTPIPSQPVLQPNLTVNNVATGQEIVTSPLPSDPPLGSATDFYGIDFDNSKQKVVI